LILGCVSFVMQASVLDGFAFDPFSFQQDGLAASEGIVPTPLRPPRRGFPPNAEWQPIGGLRVVLKLDEAPRVASGTGAEQSLRPSPG
jgi:hypothetical protein